MGESRDGHREQPEWRSQQEESRRGGGLLSRFSARHSRARQSAGATPDDEWDDISWDDTWEGNWETGEWNAAWGATGNADAATGWATDAQGMPAAASAAATRRTAGGRDDDGRDDTLGMALNTLAQLGAVGAPLSRLARIRLLMRRRPAAAAMLAFFLLGFMLTCCAPAIPLLRLGYDAADAAYRVSVLQQMLAGDSAQLLNGDKLNQAQAQVDGLERDLYEINGAVGLVGAPIGALSPAARDDQLLVRIGFDLSAASDDSIQVARTVLTPLQGGALSASDTPALQPSDIQQARNLLADAQAHTLDALAAYHQIDQSALPSQFKPGSKYGKLLALLPLAPNIFAELKTLLDAAPGLLGIGQPAYYLVVAMDRTELRAGGGFQGNYGILEIKGGRQSKTPALSLGDVYPLDAAYALANPETPPAGSSCGHTTPEPPEYYWWWPVRCDPKYGWGLRDSNLSPDFPTNAQTAMQIVQDTPNQVPNGAHLAGEIAFTPVLIEDLLSLTGSITLKQYHVTVTPQNLEATIHYFQLVYPNQGERKQFTHLLSATLLARIKSLHSAQLKSVLTLVEHAILTKDLQIYLADPRAELILRQLGLASSVNTGGGDGFFVVDTNNGANKANIYITEQQTDLVTLLPNGGALHHLHISVTYNKQGTVYNLDTPFEDYSDIQRTYVPGDATLLGWSGFVPPNTFGASACGFSVQFSSPITDCAVDHLINGVTTNSDVAGRAMVMGSLLLMCGDETAYNQYNSRAELQQCDTTPMAHTQDIFLIWYTPHAYTRNADGHGIYSELIERQAGSVDTLAVYIATGAQTPTTVVSDPASYAALLQQAKLVYNHSLDTNTTITYAF
ncbi:MAG: DUF4012 domain-containing protein [Ktedonobacterales bacterium]